MAFLQAWPTRVRQLITTPCHVRPANSALLIFNHFVPLSETHIVHDPCEQHHPPSYMSLKIKMNRHYQTWRVLFHQTSLFPLACLPPLSISSSSSLPPKSWRYFLLANINTFEDDEDDDIIFKYFTQNLFFLRWRVYFFQIQKFQFNSWNRWRER